MFEKTMLYLDVLDELAAQPDAHPSLRNTTTTRLDVQVALALTLVANPLNPGLRRLAVAMDLFAWLKAELPDRKPRQHMRFLVIALARTGWAPYQLAWLRSANLAASSGRLPPDRDAARLPVVAPSKRDLRIGDPAWHILVELESLVERIFAAVRLRWIGPVDLGRLHTVAVDLRSAYEINSRRMPIRGAGALVRAFESSHSSRCDQIIDRLDELLDKIILLAGTDGLTELELADLEMISFLFRRALDEEHRRKRSLSA
jgi:hypothetical protein